MRLFTNSRGQAITPTVLIIAAAFAGVYYVGEGVVKVVKKVDTVVASQAKRIGHDVIHIVTLGRK